MAIDLKQTDAGMLAPFIKSLTQKHLDIRLATGPGYETRIAECPGLWMGEADCAALVTDLRQVASRAMPGGDLTYGVFSGDRQVLDRTILTVVYRLNDRVPVAFNALAVLERSLNGRKTRVLHLGLVMIDPEMRSQGLSWVLYGLTCFFLFLRNQLRPLWVSNVTQVPAVAGMVAETFSNVYPSPLEGSHRSFDHVLLARGIAAEERPVFGVGPEAVFDESRFVLENAYTGGSDDLKKTFSSAPKHRNALFNDFCAQQLDYQRGDDLLQIGQIDLKAAQAFLTHSVPRGALGAIAVAALMVLLQRLALPLLYWADPTRPFGVLRPWRDVR